MSELFKRSQPKTNFAEVHKLIHGEVKTGKTTLAAQFKVGGKEALFIATEDGHHNLNVLHEPVANWLQFKMLVKKLETNLPAVKLQVSTVVLDLLSDLDQWCNDHVCNELKVKNLADLDFGKGFSANKREFQSVMSKLLSLMPVTFICHSKEKKLEFDGVEVAMQAPNLSNGTMEYVNGKVDIIGFMCANPKTKNTLITFRPSKLAVAGTRFPQLAKEFDLNPTDMTNSYKAINDAFVNKQ